MPFTPLKLSPSVKQYRDGMFSAYGQNNAAVRQTLEQLGALEQAVIQKQRHATFWNTNFKCFHEHKKTACDKLQKAFGTVMARFTNR